MNFKSTILKTALNWRIDYLSSRYKHRPINSSDFDSSDIVDYREEQIKSDEVLKKIYNCQNMISEIEKEQKEMSGESLIVGSLFCLTIFGLVWVLLEFAKFNGVV